MDDFISRQSAIDALGERPMVWTEDNEYDLGCASQYDSDRLAIETVSSADVQPVRHGQWIGYLKPGCESYHCTACGTAWYPEDLYLGGNDYPKYCPECGAKMENWKSEMDGE